MQNIEKNMKVKAAVPLKLDMRNIKPYSDGGPKCLAQQIISEERGFTQSFLRENLNHKKH